MVADRCVPRLSHRAAAVALSLAVFVTLQAVAAAQVVTLSTEVLRDDIPATVQRSGASLLWQPGTNWLSRTGYRYVFADQDAFNGIPRLRPSVHAIDQALELRLPEAGLAVGVRGTISRVQDGSIRGDHAAELRASRQITLGSDAVPLRTAVRLHGGRDRQLGVSTAIMKNISAEFAGADAEAALGILQAHASVLREWFNDGNRKDVAYVYLLARLLDVPDITVGYAWSWSDSEWSTWRRTRSTFDPRARQFLYDYFYDPYFTPLAERGHLLIGIVHWPVTDWLLVRGKVSMPVWSRGKLKWMPVQGATPEPVDYGVTYDITGILPAQIEGGLIVQLARPVTLDLGVESFSKPYYSYVTGRLTLLYSPFLTGE